MKTHKPTNIKHVSHANTYTDARAHTNKHGREGQVGGGKERGGEMEGRKREEGRVGGVEEMEAGLTDRGWGGEEREGLTERGWGGERITRTKAGRVVARTAIAAGTFQTGALFSLPQPRLAHTLSSRTHCPLCQHSFGH